MTDYARSNLARTFFGGKSQTGGGNKPSIFKTNLSDLFNLITSKKEFFIMIFANLIVQIGITYYVMEKTNIGPNNKDTKNKITIEKIIPTEGCSSSLDDFPEDRNYIDWKLGENTGSIDPSLIYTDVQNSNESEISGELMEQEGLFYFDIPPS